MSLEKNFDLEGDLQAVLTAIENELRAIGQEMTDAAMKQIRQHEAIATGDLINSVDDRVEVHAEGVTLIFGVLSGDAPHWKYVEWGTPPHWAPIQPLKRWARQKFSAVDEEKNAIAYAAQAKIAERGTDPVHFLRTALAKQGIGLVKPSLAGTLGAIRVLRPTIQKRLDNALEEALDANA